MWKMNGGWIGLARVLYLAWFFKKKIKNKLKISWKTWKIPISENWPKPRVPQNSIPLCCEPCRDERSIFFFNQTYCCMFDAKSDPCPDLSYSTRLKVYAFLTIAAFIAALGATCINSHRLFVEKREIVDKAKRQEAARDLWYKKFGRPPITWFIFFWIFFGFEWE